MTRTAQIAAWLFCTVLPLALPTPVPAGEADAARELAGKLVAADAAAREALKELFLRLGPGSPGTVEALAQALDHENAATRLLAVEILERYGYAPEGSSPWNQSGTPPADWNATDRLRTAAPRLRAILSGDRDPKVRAAAVKAVLAMERSGGFKAVGERLADDDVGVRAAVAEALADWTYQEEASLAILLKALEDREARVRQAAAESLGRWGDKAEPAVARLAKGALDADGGAAGACIRTLAELKDKAAPALPALLKVAEGQDAALAASALKTIAAVGPGAKDAVAPAMRLLAHTDAKVREAAAGALGALGPAARGAVPTLIRASEDPEDAVAAAAVRALGGIGELPETSVLVMETLLDDPRRDVRLAALGAVGRFGKTAEPLVPRLMKQLDSDDDRVRWLAFDSLARAGRDIERNEPIVRELIKRSEENRTMLDASGALGTMGKSALKAFVAILGDPDPKLRLRAMVGIAALEKDGAGALDAVRRALADADQQVRVEAVIAVVKIVADEKQELEIITPLLDDKELAVAAVAARQLMYRNRILLKPAAPGLVRLLGSGHDDATHFAMVAINNSGLKPPEAIEPLGKLLASGNGELQWLAAHILGGFGPQAESQMDRLLVLMGEERRGHDAGQTAAWAVACIGPKAVGPLTAALEDPSPTRRRHAAYALSLLKKDAAPALDRLRRALDAKDLRLRLAAADAVREITGEDAEALPVYAAILKDRDSDALGPALSSLKALGPKAAPLLSDLMKVVEKGHPYDAVHALEVVQEIGPDAAGAVPELVAMLGHRQFSHTNVDAVRAAVVAIGVKAVPALLKAAESRDWVKRKAVVGALGGIGPENRETVDCPIRMLGDENEAVREEAAGSLGHWSDLAAVAAPALAKALRDPAPAVRAAAAGSLIEAGFRRPGTAFELAAALRDSSPLVRKQAVKTLRFLWPEESPADEVRFAVAELRRALGDSDPKVREEAADSLIRFGPRAASAVPELRRTLADAEEETRASAAWALGKTGAPAIQALPELLKMLREGTSRDRIGAAWALGNLPKGNRQAIAALREALTGRDDAVRCWVAWALWKQTGDPKPASREICRVLGAEDTSGHYAALQVLKHFGGSRDADAIRAVIKALDGSYYYDATLALADFGTAAAEAGPALEKIMAAKDGFPADQAAFTHFRVTGDPVKAVTFLVGRLSDRHYYTRKTAAWHLEEMGPAAKGAVPALQMAREDRHWEVRWAAARALLKIEGQGP
jgi:HEAT repeat protein